MSLDWIDFYHFQRDAQAILDNSKVQKIFQPLSDHVVIELYSEKQRTFLNITASQAYPGIFLSSHQGPQPDDPSAFCMLLRKHLTGSFLRSIIQPEFERVLFFEFEFLEGRRKLVLDFRGRRTNLYLCDDQECILGSQERQSGFANGMQFKLEEHPLPTFTSGDYEHLHLTSDKTKLLNLGREITPKLADYLLSLELAEFNIFMTHFSENLEGLLSNPTFEIWADELGPQTINVLNGAKHSGSVYQHKNMLDLLSEFCLNRRDKALLRNAKERALRSIQKQRKSLELKHERTTNKLAEYKTYPELERVAALLNSQRDKIKPFNKSVVLTDYYGDCQELEVQIDPRQSVQGNVDKFYKKARKFRRGIEKLESQLQEIQELTSTLDRNLEELRHCSDHREVESLLLRLQNLGLVPTPKSGKLSPRKKKKANRARLRMFLSSEGVEIYAGRNNVENDYILKSVAAKDDLWFHVKDCPGAHVLLRSNKDTGRISKQEAAQLAAYLSRKKNDVKAEVMYTAIKHVRKLPGMKPGEVSLRQFDCMQIKVDLGILSKLERNVHKTGE